MLTLNKHSRQLGLLEYWDEAFASLPLQEFKYKRWGWAYNNIPDVVQPLLSEMLDIMGDVDVQGLGWLVDYKVRDLKVGECGCMLEGWHLDVVPNPHHDSKPDIHLIYSTEFGTDFLTKELPVSEGLEHFKDVLSDYSDSELEDFCEQSKPNSVSMYNRFQLHRGPVVTKDCRRMLLRLTATEVIR